MFQDKAELKNTALPMSRLKTPLKHFVPNVFFTEWLHAHDGNQRIVAGCGLLQALQTIGYHCIYHLLLQ